MKKLVIPILVVVVIVAIFILANRETEPGSNSFNPVDLITGHSDATCQLNWDELDVEPDMVGWMVDQLLNSNHPPDSVGAILRECIEDGWTGWR